jgi:hypothetical protein
MPFPVPNKANKTPISTILKWYLERKKGKVVESRQEIQRRFGGLDWSIQKIVISAFLSSGKADRKWAYEQIVWLWDNDFLQKVKEVFEKYHEKGCYRPVTWYFPTSYILEHFDELAVEHNYYSLCYRLAYEKIDFEPDRKKLSPKEYFAIIDLAHKTVKDELVIDILFDVLHDLCTNKISKYDGISPRHIIERGKPLVASDFIYVYSLTKKIIYLGYEKPIEVFQEWEKELFTTINNSREFQILNEVNPHNYSEQRRIIAKRYMFKLLPEKYKSASEMNPFADDEEIFEKMKENNPTLESFANKMRLEVVDSVNL